MSADNIVKASFVFGKSTKTRGLHQWDYGQVLQFEGLSLPSAYTVHFANQSMSGDAKTQVGGPDGVDIPDEYLTTGLPVYAWVYLHTGADDGEAVYSVTIPVTKRPQPTEEPPTPQQQGAIDQAIAALNEGVETVQDIAEAIPQTIDAALTEAKESGEFDGPPGPQGEQGEPGQNGAPGQPGTPGFDGVSPIVTVTDITGGHRVTITDAEGAHVFDVMDAVSTFVAVYGQTTREEVTAAVQNGLQVVAMKDGIAYPMTFRSPYGSCEFCIVNGRVIDYVRLLSGGWSAGSYGDWAEVDSPVLINPRASATPSEGSSNTLLATTEFVQRAVHNIPTGGTTGQVLSKASSTDYDTEWTTPTGGGVVISGSVSVSGSTPTINAQAGVRYVCGEVATLDITLPASGCIDVVFECGSTPTVLTITPPTGVTLKWANGFDPTALEADTTYELNVADGLGVAGSWT